VGVPGELYIGGEGLAQGYWKHPELSVERFIPHPFAVSDAAKLYRTGDLVRYLPDGRLEFLRRIDTQVKIRGFRIELDEVESVLREHPGVRAAAATVVDAGPGDKRLVAYIVPSEGSTVREAELREFLEQKLPSYMVPSGLVSRRNLPLTPNGKMDRNALSATAPNGFDQRHSESRAPRDPIERRLVKIWENILHRRPIGIDDSFFDLGGHSLLGVRLLSRMEQVFKGQLTLARFFEAPTIAHVASLLRNAYAPRRSRVIFLQSSGRRPPLVVVHPLPSFCPLLQRLDEDQPVIGITLFEPSALPARCRLEEIAAHQVKALRSFRPEGPYLLAGHCADGVLAYEMARQLTAQGQSVPIVVMLDSFNPATRNRWSVYKSRLRRHLGNISRLDSVGAAGYSVEHLRNLIRQIREEIEIRTWRTLSRLRARDNRRLDQPWDVWSIIQLAASEYRPQPYEGCVLLITAEASLRDRQADATFGWNTVASELDITEVPGNHHTMFTEPNVESVAAAINAKLLNIRQDEDLAGTSGGISSAVSRPANLSSAQ
jgi:thioesterase domain-containing protein